MGDSTRRDAAPLRVGANQNVDFRASAGDNVRAGKSSSPRSKEDTGEGRVHQQASPNG